MSYHRTPEHRKMRAELIRQWRPWEKSTGPRTEEGKARSAQNSYVHGVYIRAFVQHSIDVNRLIKAWKQRRKATAK